MGRNAPLTLLYDDDRIVAVAKPSGLATVPGRDEPDSLLQRLAEQMGLAWKGKADPRLRLVHRLDKQTSGILLMAKDVEAQRHLSHQFQNNRVEKQYLALVHGRPSQPEGVIEAPLGVDPNSSKRMAVVKKGKWAVTYWRVEQVYRMAALLRVFPKTGKMHQIRVHLKYIGHPLLVDPLYNPPREGQPIGLFLSQFKRGYIAKKHQPERPLIDRLTLHAVSLVFNHPDGSDRQITCDPPKDFRAAINSLRKFAKG